MNAIINIIDQVNNIVTYTYFLAVMSNQTNVSIKFSLIIITVILFLSLFLLLLEKNRLKIFLSIKTLLNSIIGSVIVLIIPFSIKPFINFSRFAENNDIIKSVLVFVLFLFLTNVFKYAIKYFGKKITNKNGKDYLK